VEGGSWKKEKPMNQRMPRSV